MLALGPGCAKDPPTTARTVTLNVPRTCAADGSAYANYYALGDFEPAAPSKGHLLSTRGETLGEFDLATRALVAQVTEGDREWFGEGEVGPSGDVDILILPWLSSCPLSTPIGARTRSMLGAIGSSRVLLLGGTATLDAGGVTSSAPAATYVAHLDTGLIAAARPDLRIPRIQASLTAFGDGGLVAGGFDASSGTVLDGAEVYVSGVDGFDQQHPILLSHARANHGAAVLATGETLLVGGVDSDGHVLNSMEVVDPVTRTVRAVNVATLSVARQGATVLRLASAEILVAGGQDEGSNPVTTLEWFSPDAARATKRARDLVAGSARAYVALDGGGALAVIAPPPDAPPDFQSAWVIDADGSLEPAAAVPGVLGQPVLFGRAGSAPALWTGHVWLRWQPWEGAFGALGVLDDSPAQVGEASPAPDPGLSLWLDATTRQMTGLRFDVRGAYSTLPDPLLVADTSNVAPDRLPAPGVVTFDPGSGLTLGPGASAFVTDRTYAGLVLDVDAPTGEPALVVLRDELGDELEVGGAACPGALLATAGSPSSTHVVRSGADVHWSVTTGAAGTCSAGVRSDARISVGVRAPSSAARSVVRNLRLVRERAM
jgi:hypothetical protein